MVSGQRTATHSYFQRVCFMRANSFFGRAAWVTPQLSLSSNMNNTPPSCSPRRWQSSLIKLFRKTSSLCCYSLETTNVTFLVPAQHWVTFLLTGHYTSVLKLSTPSNAVVYERRCRLWHMNANWWSVHCTRFVCCFQINILLLLILENTNVLTKIFSWKGVNYFTHGTHRKPDKKFNTKLNRTADRECWNKYISRDPFRFWRRTLWERLRQQSCSPFIWNYSRRHECTKSQCDAKASKKCK